MKRFGMLLGVLISGLVGFGVVLAVPGGPEVYQAQIVDLATGISAPPPE